MTTDDVLLDAEERMEKTVTVFADSLMGLRAGTASPGLVESIRVDYHGSQLQLRQLAQISVPDPQLIVVRPYDPSVVQEVCKAFQKSDLGINPQTDGRVIRLAVPGLSEERRKQLVARVRDMAEEARVSIRNIRRDANKALDRLKKDSAISEDSCRTAKDDVQEQTSSHTDKIDEVLEKRAADIMKV